MPLPLAPGALEVLASTDLTLRDGSCPHSTPFRAPLASFQHTAFQLCVLREASLCRLFSLGLSGPGCLRSRSPAPSPVPGTRQQLRCPELKGRTQVGVPAARLASPVP